MLSDYFRLLPEASLPIVMSVAFYLLEKRTFFGKANYWLRQLVYGFAFGVLSIFGTEFGVLVNGVTMNIRDAGPICAGLIFGAPAGVIAGLMGGVERYLAASWAGTYTKVACSVATVFAGLFSAWLRKYMFDNKKPAWFYGLATGSIVEVVHMLMVFLLKIDDARKAFTIVQKCALPMVLLTGVSVMFAVGLVTFFSGEKMFVRREKIKITQTFQRKLLISVAFAFFCTSIFTFKLQNGVSNAEVESILSLNISDIIEYVSETSDENLSKVSENIANEINKSGRKNGGYFSELCKKYGVSEINYVGEKEIIEASSNGEIVGYDMNSSEKSAVFLSLLKGEEVIVEKFSETPENVNVSMKYAGVALKSGGFVQVGYDYSVFKKSVDATVAGSAESRRVGENGYLMICDADKVIISDRIGNKGKALNSTGFVLYPDEQLPLTIYTAEINGESSYFMYDVAEGYYIFAVMPETEAVFSRDMTVYLMIIVELLIFAALFILVYFLIKNLIVDKIKNINDSLGEITGGNLNVKVNVRSNEEFASLSDDINATVVTLKNYIDEAAARIDKELEVAKAIQTSALPKVYPDRDEFEIWAGMKPAKEVGGDFYDFYMMGEDKVAFLIADVSGKGIPAAMFMMTSKTMLKNHSEAGMAAAENFTVTNEQLCATNEAGMFVTAWMGILDLKTGLVSFANAGHNPPLVKHADGKFEYLRSRAGFVLAGMEGMKYKSNELQLEPGDAIYLYTDGVTEATDSSNHLYGEERLLNMLNTLGDSKAENICRSVKADVDKFVGEAPQFDDITMLCIEFKQRKE